MTRSSVLVVESCPGEARFIEDALVEAVERGATAHLFAPLCLEDVEDALIVLAAEKVDAVVLGSTPAPARDLGRILEAAPGVPVVVVLGPGERSAGLAALRQGAQDYLFRGEFDYAPLARSVENAVERNKSVQALRSVAMRDPSTGLLSETALAAFCARDGSAADIVVAEYDPLRLGAREAADAWADAVGADALPARIGIARLAAILSSPAASVPELQARLHAATGSAWSVSAAPQYASAAPATARVRE